MKTILFQGDSITDCGRLNTISQLGDGYACFTAAHLALENPGEYTFYNAKCAAVKQAYPSPN